MHKDHKQRVVAELTDRLKSTDTLIVADYRGLTMPQIDELRSELLKHGARFQVVKNTLTRRAAEAAGAETVLALLEGPTAIAFLEGDADPVAVAKALSAAGRDTRVLAVRGGILEGRPITPEEVESLGKLPPVDVLRGQVLGAVTAPLQTIVGLFTAPLQDLVGLIDARVEQLGGEGDSGSEPQGSAEEASAPEASGEPAEEAGGSGSQTPTAEATQVGAENEEETSEADVSASGSDREEEE
jgi:large subunit ribosomal protein L10